ncbi:hypothetical protein D3C80_1927130 [compost metagenome]
MAVADGKLALSRLFTEIRDAAEIKRGRKACPVRTGLTMDEDGFRRITHDRDQLIHRGHVKFVAG